MVVATISEWKVCVTHTITIIYTILFSFTVSTNWSEYKVGFELHDSTYMHIIFNKYTVSPLYPGVSYLWIQPTMNWKQYFWSVTDWKSTEMEGWWYALFYTILGKGLDHPWILVSVRVLAPFLHRYRGNTEFLVSEKLYVDFGPCKRVGDPSPHVVQCSIVQDFFPI